jgi:tryptophan synthase alpha chain
VAAIQAAFERAAAQERCALITFLTLGYPTLDASLELVPALARGGADLIELGVPFSDPVADGATIQRSSFQALQAGMTPRRGLAMVEALRAGGLTTPVLLMGYYNPILSYGAAAYVRDALAVGVDGLIVPDLPPEEAAPLEALCRQKGLALVLLVAPTSDTRRVAEIARRTTGFLYVVSQLGTTGRALQADQALTQRLAAVRALAQTPVAVGFGVSQPQDVASLADLADGVIVGSAVVQRAQQGAEELERYVASLRAATVHDAGRAGAE